jgi:hypothetical protein
MGHFLPAIRSSFDKCCTTHLQRPTVGVIRKWAERGAESRLFCSLTGNFPEQNDGQIIK